MIYGQVNCPNCGRFTTIHLNKNDIRRDMRLACEHCQHNEQATEWRDILNRKGKRLEIWISINLMAYQNDNNNAIVVT